LYVHIRCIKYGEDIKTGMCPSRKSTLQDLNMEMVLFQNLMIGFLMQLVMHDKKDMI